VLRDLLRVPQGFEENSGYIKQNVRSHNFFNFIFVTTMGYGFHFQHEILARFQSKAPWYVPNTVIRWDLQIPTVKEEIRHYSSQYSARLSAHPNGLVVNL
jgi:hypothetical protein